MDHPLSIGEVAEAAGLTPDAIRYYEREGLLPVADRSAGGRRVYAPSVLDALAVVGTLRRAGFGIGDIRDFMAIKVPGSSAAERLAAADVALTRLEAALEERERAVQQARSLVAGYRAELDAHVAGSAPVTDADSRRHAAGGSQ